MRFGPVTPVGVAAGPPTRRPDLVQLDLGLVRGDADAGRQALVGAMQHLARATGCRLVAEGVETEVEARTLLELGVEFGQGYLFGPPAPAP